MRSNNIIDNALFDRVDLTTDNGFTPDDNIRKYIDENKLGSVDFANDPRELEKINQAENYMINAYINEWNNDWNNKISQEDKDYLLFPKYTSYYMSTIKRIEHIGTANFYQNHRKKLFKARPEHQTQLHESGGDPNLLDDNKREQYGDKFDKLFDAFVKQNREQQRKNQEKVSTVKGNEFTIHKKNIANTRNYKVKDPLYELLNNKDKFKLLYAFVKQKREQQIKNQEQINTIKENEQQIENQEQASPIKENEFTIHKKNIANTRNYKVKDPLYELSNNKEFCKTILNKYLEYKQQQKQGINTNNNKNFHPKVQTKNDLKLKVPKNKKENDIWQIIKTVCEYNETKNILNRVENNGKYKQFCQNNYR